MSDDHRTRCLHGLRAGVAFHAAWSGQDLAPHLPGPDTPHFRQDIIALKIAAQDSSLPSIEHFWAVQGQEMAFENHSGPGAVAGRRCLAQDTGLSL